MITITANCQFIIVRHANGTTTQFFDLQEHAVRVRLAEQGGVGAKLTFRWRDVPGAMTVEIDHVDARHPLANVSVRSQPHDDDELVVEVDVSPSADARPTNVRRR